MLLTYLLYQSQPWHLNSTLANDYCRAIASAETRLLQQMTSTQLTNLANIRRDEIADELFHIVVDCASFLDGGHDRREVVIGEHHL